MQVAQENRYQPQECPITSCLRGVRASGQRKLLLVGGHEIGLTTSD